MNICKPWFSLPTLGAILLSFGPSPAFSADIVTGTLVQTIDTSQFNPPSPDPSDIAYLSISDTMLVCDAEVEEMTIYAGANLFEMTRSGSLLSTATTTAYSDEPVGCNFNPTNGHIFISDDDQKLIFEIDPGADGQLFTLDDTRSSFSTTDFNSFDPEGVAFDPGEGALYVADGLNSEVYKVLPGPDGRFDTTGDNQVTNFDTLTLGVRDPEGIVFDPPDRLYLVGKPTAQMAHVYSAGALLRTVDISQANPVKPAGLDIAPGSSNSSVSNVYLSDRGVDNDSDPNENDGKVYEISVPAIPAGNLPPGVSAGPDLTIAEGTLANLDGILVDDGLPNPPGQVSTAWTQVAGPGTATFGNPGAVDTTASFSAAGFYTLRLTASDSALQASDDVMIQVRAPFSAPFGIIYVSATSSDTAGGSLVYSDEDIIANDPTSGTWSMYFDGSDVGLDASGVDVDAFMIMNDNSILLSFSESVQLTVEGVSTVVDDSDIVRFFPTSLGDITAGTFEWFFDGSDVGLDASSENIDAIGFNTAGNLVVSTTGNFSAPGVSGKDEDFIAFLASDLGEETTGTWEIFFDGSDVELTNGVNEDINGTWIDGNGDIYLTNKGTFLVTGAGGGPDDIFRCIPSSTGSKTRCAYDFVWDGVVNGLKPGVIVDGIALERSLVFEDNIPPMVSITAPSSGSTVSSPLSITADASDNVGVAGVQFQLDGVDLGTEDTTAPYSILWDPSTTTTGPHSLTAVARDAAGNTTSSSAVSVTVVDNPTANTIYVSMRVGGTIPGVVSFEDEDILAYDTNTGTWSMYLDGSDVGLAAGGVEIDAFHIMTDGSILLSTSTDGVVIPDGVGPIDDSDIVRFVPTSLGDTTAGTFEWYFDGSDVGLDQSGEDIDAIGFTTDGKLTVSTGGSFAVTGVSGKDEDLIAFTETLLGETTTGTFEMFIDGSDVELGGNKSEDVNGAWIGSGGKVYLTTVGDFAVTGASGAVTGGGDDIFVCTPASTGNASACSDYEVVWDGVGSGLPAGTAVSAMSLAL